MQVSEQLTSNDRTKFIAILSYMTIVGWLIALVLHGKDKDPLARFSFTAIVRIVCHCYDLSVCAFSGMDN